MSANKMSMRKAGAAKMSQNEAVKKLQGGRRKQIQFFRLTFQELKEKYISAAESVLLDALVNDDMPPGRIPSASKGKSRVIRPSSAAANIQTHPSFSTGLYDNVTLRPATAAAAGRRQEPAPLVQRPATQAVGARRQWRTSKEDTVLEPKEINKQPRRLTIGAVDGIARDTTKIHRPGISQGSQATLLKSKVVSLLYSLFNWRFVYIGFD
ncbi:uncharacterized protein LOC128556878 [Mercenaria mercenaria]|uniref:uncharacterized protein LOC128556878 n=1 Tax=Mercenaria mercenaria TaxID=6596 RepID=UPI00234E40B5|nr:uncharacterized protein LOC128556878 [Mercenaria mercenaria]